MWSGMVHTDNHQLKFMTFPQNILTFSGVAQRSETPDLIFAVSCLQRSKISAGMKLQKGGFTPQKLGGKLCNLLL